MKKIKYKLDDFGGGFSASVREDAMHAGFTTDSYNVEALNGSLKTMHGCSLYIDGDLIYENRKYYPMQFMIKYAEYRTDRLSDEDKLMIIANNVGQMAIFIYDDEGIKVGNNSIYGQLDYINYYFSSGNKMLMCNTVSGVYIYSEDENKFNRISGSPYIKSMALQGERIWGIGTDDKPNTVYYSAEGDPEKWNSETSDAGELVATTADGDHFVAIANVFGDILLYRYNSLFRITGTSPSTYRITEIPAASGAVNEFAIANNTMYSFYVGFDGIYRYDGAKAYMLENDRLSLFFKEKVNKNKLNIIGAVIHNNKLYVALPTGTSTYNDTIIEYDILTGVFNLRSGVDVLNMIVFNDKILFIDSNRHICELNSGETYKGSNILAHYETPFYDFDSKNAIKTLESVYFVARGTGSVKVSAKTENGIRTVIVPLSESNNFNLYEIPIYNVGRRFKFMFDNVDGSTFEIVSPEFNLEMDDED